MLDCTCGDTTTLGFARLLLCTELLCDGVLLLVFSIPFIYNKFKRKKKKHEQNTQTTQDEEEFCTHNTQSNRIYTLRVFGLFPLNIFFFCISNIISCFRVIITYRSFFFFFWYFYSTFTYIYMERCINYTIKYLHSLFSMYIFVVLCCIIRCFDIYSW